MGKIIIIIVLIFFGFSMAMACPCDKSKVNCGDTCKVGKMGVNGDRAGMGGDKAGMSSKEGISDSIQPQPINLNLPGIFGRDLMVSAEITMPLSGQFEASYRTMVWGCGGGFNLDYRGLGGIGWCGLGLNFPGIAGFYGRIDADWHSEINLGISAQATRPIGDFNFVTDHWPVYAMARCGWMNKKGWLIGIGVSFGYIIKNYNN